MCWIQQKITQNISCIWNIFITQKLIYAILKLTDNQIIRRLLLNKVRGKNLYLGILINLLLVTNKWLETIEAPKNEKLSIRLKHKWYCRNVKPLKNNGLLQGVQPNYDGIIITILKYTRFIRWHFWVKWTVLKVWRLLWIMMAWVSDSSILVNTAKRWPKLIHANSFLQMLYCSPLLKKIKTIFFLITLDIKWLIIQNAVEIT